MNNLVETEIGHFPATWHVQRLGELFETQLGKMLSQKARVGNSPKPYLRNKNVQWGRIDVSDMLYMDFDDRETEKFRLCAGDLLVCEGGEPGRAAIWNGALTECFYQKALHRLRPRDGRILSEFMNHWLRFSFDLQNLYGVAGASSTIAHLPEVQLKSLPIPVPPLPEQRKIAAVLGLAHRAIEQQERLIALTTELKKTLLHKLFTEGLHGEPQKQTAIGPVPESWDETSLGKLAAKPHGFLQTGPFGSQLHKHEYLKEGIGVVNPTHLWGNRINHEDIPQVSKETAARLERHCLKAGDILFARRGEIGRHGLVTKAEEDWLCGTGCFLARVHHKHIDNRFLSYLFSTPGVIAWLNSHAAGAIMPNLNNTVLRSMPVFYPKFDVQVEIADCLDACEQKMINHVRKKESFTNLFRTLLHQLMTAQIRVHDLDLTEKGIRMVDEGTL
jgi:type I restriction enzyme, S subunit